MSSCLGQTRSEMMMKKFLFHIRSQHATKKFQDGASKIS